MNCQNWNFNRNQKFKANDPNVFFKLCNDNVFFDLVGLVTSWVSSNYHSRFLQVSLCQVKVNDCPAGLDNWPRRVRAPRRGQKQEKSYCDYLKKPMMSPNRRAPKDEIKKANKKVQVFIIKIPIVFFSFKIYLQE